MHAAVPAFCCVLTVILSQHWFVTANRGSSSLLTWFLSVSVAISQSAAELLFVCLCYVCICVLYTTNLMLFYTRCYYVGFWNMFIYMWLKKWQKDLFAHRNLFYYAYVTCIPVVGKPRGAWHKRAHCKCHKQWSMLIFLHLINWLLSWCVFKSGSHGSQWSSRSTRCEGEFVMLCVIMMPLNVFLIWWT